MQNERPLNIPVLLGTVRKGRASAHVARFLLEQVRERERVVTELIDITKLSFPIDDAGQAIKDKDLSEKMNSADGLVIVAPEYNHSFPGLLKHVLDSNLMEYVHGRRNCRRLRRSFRRHTRDSELPRTDARVGIRYHFLRRQL